MFKSLIKIFYKPYKSGLAEIDLEQYKKDFLEDKTKAEKAFDKAWATRNFEIDLYWKRANYFWAFLIPAFAGLFALINSDNYKKPDNNSHIEVYLIICVGFIISCAWGFVNKGSKAWQRHWEIHVDLLEDAFTGPLYKTVYPNKTYSVSKINEIISWFFSIVWILFGWKYFLDQKITIFSFRNDIHWLVLVSTISVLLCLMAMTSGYGRGYFSERSFTMYRRNIAYTSSNVKTTP